MKRILIPTLLAVASMIGTATVVAHNGWVKVPITLSNEEVEELFLNDEPFVYVAEERQKLIELMFACSDENELPETLEQVCTRIAMGYCILPHRDLRVINREIVCTEHNTTMHKIAQAVERIEQSLKSYQLEINARRPIGKENATTVVRTLLIAPSTLKQLISYASLFTAEDRPATQAEINIMISPAAMSEIQADTYVLPEAVHPTPPAAVAEEEPSCENSEHSNEIVRRVIGPIRTNKISPVTKTGRVDEAGTVTICGNLNVDRGHVLTSGDKHENLKFTGDTIEGHFISLNAQLFEIDAPVMLEAHNILHASRIAPSVTGKGISGTTTLSGNVRIAPNKTFRVGGGADNTQGIASCGGHANHAPGVMNIGGYGSESIGVLDIGGTGKKCTGILRVGVGAQGSNNRIHVGGGNHHTPGIVAVGGREEFSPGYLLVYGGSDGKRGGALIEGNLVIRGDVQIDGDLDHLGEINDISDLRVKTDIRDIDPSESLEKITQLKPKKYCYDREYSRLPHGEQRGLIAQEVRKVLPEVTTVIPTRSIGEHTLRNVHQISYEKLVVDLIGAVKALDSRVSELESDLDAACECITRLLDEQEKAVLAS